MLRAVDQIDRRILRELQSNARLSYRKLGRRVSITAPAIAERIHRMESAGIIVGYRVQLDAARLGMPITAFIRVATVGQEKCAQFAALVKDMPEVLESHRLTGGDSYIVKIVARSTEHLEALIDQMMPYGQPATSIVLSSPVTMRIIDWSGSHNPEGARRLARQARERRNATRVRGRPNAIRA